MVRRTEWSQATILKSCFGLVLDSTLMFAWVSTIVTSTSAMADRFSAMDSFVAAEEL